MQRYTVYLYLETALHILGDIFIHHQEHTIVSTASGTCQTVPATCRYRGRVGTAMYGPLNVKKNVVRPVSPTLEVLLFFISCPYCLTLAVPRVPLKG